MNFKQSLALILRDSGESADELQTVVSINTERRIYFKQSLASILRDSRESAGELQADFSIKTERQPRVSG